MHWSLKPKKEVQYLYGVQKGIKMDTPVLARSFDEYWEKTEWNRDGYPPELIELLRQFERNAWKSAIISAENCVYLALQDFNCRLVPHDGPVGPARIALDTIGEMRDG